MRNTRGIKVDKKMDSLLILFQLSLSVCYPGENGAVLLSRSALRKRKKHASKLGLGLRRHLPQ